MDPTSLAVQLGITFGLKALQWYLSEPEEDPRPQRYTEEPTVTEGDPMPISYGRVRVRQSLLAWHSFIIQTRKAHDFDPPGTIESFGPDTSGLNMLFNLGLVAGPVSATPQARLVGFYIGEDKLSLGGGLGGGDFVMIVSGTNSGSPSNQRAFRTQVGDPYGKLQFFAGTSTQLLSTNATTPGVNFTDLTDIAYFMRRDFHDYNGAVPYSEATLIPSYRGQAIVTLTGDASGAYYNLTEFFFGNNQSLPPISFELACSWALWGPATVLGNGDANPVDVIYDLLTNPWGRIGLATSLIDATSFSAVANTLFTEGHGFSMCFSSTTTAFDAIKSVIDQIGAALYYDQTTNLVKLKLIRKDYNPATIPSFNERHVSADQPPDYRLGGWSNVINTVEVLYTDRTSAYASASVVEQNQASAVVQSESSTDGRLRTVSIRYPGCTSPELAQTLARRDLSYLSQPLAVIKLTLNRLPDVTLTTNATQLRPGDVFKLSLADYGISSMIFRVESVDAGQLGSNAVTIDAVQDPFATAGQAPTTGRPIPTRIDLPPPTPINHRRLTEAPRWLAQWMATLAVIDSADKPRIMGLASNADNEGGSFAAQSTTNFLHQADQAEFHHTHRLKLVTAITREAEPYDTTTDVYVDFGAANAAFATSLEALGMQTPTNVAGGYTLFMIDEEIMAFESALDDGSGVAVLRRIWRGLLDTSATAHAVGAEGWMIGLIWGGHGHVGRRAWPVGSDLLAKFLERLGSKLGSGGDIAVPLHVAGRSLMQMPAANFGITGDSFTGAVLGMPANGYYKSVAVLEEAINFIAYKSRERRSEVIRRGDENSEDIIDANVSWSLYAQKVGAVEVPLIVGITDHGNGGVPARTLLGKVGHGDIDIILHTAKTTPAGADGVPPAVTVSTGWDSPRVRVGAPRWRSLVSNPRFGGAFTAAPDNWIPASGTPSVVAGSASLTLSASHYYATGGPAAGTSSFAQTFDVTGYSPARLAASCWFYYRNVSSDADDTITVVFQSLDIGGAVLQTATLGPVIGSSTIWRKSSLSIATLSATTTHLRITVTLAAVGDTQASSAFTECAVYLGDFVDDVLGADTSFDAGVVGSWTNVANSFVYPTTFPFASRNGTSSNYAQGGAFASSEIRKSYIVPGGREFGTFVLRFWRMTAIAGDTGQVVVEATDAAFAVLASVTTGVETMATLNVWNARRLVLDLPDGTIWVRVRLIANRAAGSGNSGACFDEFHGQLHNDLDPSYELIAKLSSPTVQQVPTTWQQWYTTYVVLVDAGIRAPDVVGPQLRVSSRYSASELRLRWSDSVDRPVDAFVGQWGAGRGSIDGTRFSRQSGGSALEIQSFAENDGARAFCPQSSGSFSVVGYLRVDEQGFAAACGVVGRADATRGWEVSIDSTGHLVATLRGDLGAKTATRSLTVTDGAVHMFALVYDAVAATLTIHDENGSNSTSTATGLGEIYNGNMQTPYRVGRSRSTIDTIPGMLSSIYYFAGHALTVAQLYGNSYSLWQYGGNPTSYPLTDTRTVAAYVVGTPDASGGTLPLIAGTQFAFGYDPDLATFADADVGDSMGLAIHQAATNLIPSWDFAGASWSKDGAVTLTQSIADPTGRLAGVRVAGSNTTNGLRVIGVTLSATATVTVVVWLRSVAAIGPFVDVELLNASNVSKQIVTFTISKLWKQYVIPFTAWDASTATGRIRVKSGSGTFDFEIGSVVFAHQSVEVPTLIAAAPLTSVPDINAEIAASVPREFGAQGEMIAEGVGTTATPSGTFQLMSVDNGANNIDARKLQAAGNVPRLAHYDATAIVNSDATAINWTLPWQLRGRWAAIKTMDATANAYAGINVAASVSSVAYGRTATFTYSTTPAVKIRLGVGGNSLNCYLRRVIVRARDPKLP